MIARGDSIPTSYVDVVERFLHREDDVLARLAWWILGIWWDMAERYVDAMLAFIQGPGWPAQEARWAALRAAGHYLSTSSNPELLGAVIEVLENADEGPSIREYAYRALAEALGHDAEKLPLLDQGPDLAHPDGLEVLAEAKERMAHEEDNKLI